MPVKNISWSRNYPVNEEIQRCANLDMETRGLTNGRCDTKMCHYCYFNKSTQFSLNGNCKDSIIDQSYTLHVDPITGKIQWKGFGKTNLVQNKDSKQWEIFQVHEPFQFNWKNTTRFS